MEIVYLPAGIQSVDVSVTSSSGSVTILDHFHTSSSSGQNVPLSSQNLRELETERLRLEDEKRLRQQSFTFLTTYMDSLAQCKSQNQAEAAHMVNFFDEFVDIGVTRSATIAELDGKLADLGSKITEETGRLTKLSNELPVKVVAVFSCNNEAPVEAAELTVTYGKQNLHLLNHLLTAWLPSCQASFLETSVRSPCFDGRKYAVADSNARLSVYGYSVDGRKLGKH